MRMAEAGSGNSWGEAPASPRAGGRTDGASSLAILRSHSCPYRGDEVTPPRIPRSPPPPMPLKNLCNFRPEICVICDLISGPLPHPSPSTLSPPPPPPPPPPRLPFQSASDFDRVQLYTAESKQLMELVLIFPYPVFRVVPLVCANCLLYACSVYRTVPARSAVGSARRAGVFFWNSSTHHTARR